MSAVYTCMPLDTPTSPCVPYTIHRADWTILAKTKLAKACLISRGIISLLSMMVQRMLDTMGLLSQYGFHPYGPIHR